VATTIDAVTAAAAAAPIRQVRSVNSVDLITVATAWVDPAMPATPSSSQMTASVMFPTVKLLLGRRLVPPSHAAAITTGTAISTYVLGWLHRRA